ncbi:MULTISPECIES: hypothetical protein [Staphylococcus]|uniref:hypothetical protein n=1 Tax=Staphylococcus TaxID=1279 RepID=UPI000C7BFFDD|nr:hypothetical protein [Staphylococcus hominis]MDH9948341.1 hypothetical protein [Staphylococcus epidermidis]MCI2894651.1 hypothetical protein [Staphylococcus hominis]MCI2898179.1 hypothetical protein [Staphylococcus hominis]MCI2903028.1 hypothetical protein [Staphylococcus hominis]MCI2905571.1 hypothetical protein [Staphylococcus hominis]
MNKINLPFKNHFSKLYTNPKWTIRLCLVLLLSIICALLNKSLTDYSESFKKIGMSQSEINDIQGINWLTDSFQGLIQGFLNTFIIFIIFLTISRIMKSKVSTLSVWAASISYMLITLIIKFIVLVIQKIFGLAVTTVKITSLNIFKPGDFYLGVMDLQLFFKVLLIGIIYYYTFQFSKKATFNWSLIALIVLLFTGLLGAYISNIFK